MVSGGISIIIGHFKKAEMINGEWRYFNYYRTFQKSGGKRAFDFAGK